MEVYEEQVHSLRYDRLNLLYQHDIWHLSPLGRYFSPFKDGAPFPFRVGKTGRPYTPFLSTLFST